MVGAESALPCLSEPDSSFSAETGVKANAKDDWKFGVLLESTDHPPIRLHSAVTTFEKQMTK